MISPATAPTLPNENLWQMDRDHALHPWINFGPFEREGSLVITRGAGSASLG